MSESTPMRFTDHLIVGVLVLTSHLILSYGSFSGTVVEAQNTNFSYVFFNSPEDFLMVDDVQHYLDKTAFVMNSRGAALSTPSCGRLLYKERVKMKDTASRAVASFYTAFTFSILGSNYLIDNSGVLLHGDGLAFTFVKDSIFTNQGAGGTLCLLKQDNNGLDTNQLFAVEFDTFRNVNFNDSSDNHIGVNLNSMNSRWAYNLCGGTHLNCTYLCNGGSFTAWIDYDSASRKLDVFFASGSLSANISKPVKPVIEATLSLVHLLPDEFVYPGFTGSVGTVSEVHQLESWQFTSSGMPVLVAASPPPLITNPAKSSSSNGSKVGIIAGVCAAVGAALLTIAGLFIARRSQGASYRKQGNKFNLVDQNLVPRVFTYKELSKATKNFARSELLGSGGFGAVYKGTLPSGSLVAVKRMRHASQQVEEGFQAEATSLSQIRHRNLVQLRGWCHEEEQLLLVYDYMCNGSLDKWLFQPSRGDQPGLTLKQRHSILSGVAAALSYLHEECKQCVLHRDTKSSNVLLDNEMNAYLGDFGLARLIDHQKLEKTTMMAGTLGYMAPEMPHTGKATKESDVYSFGVLTLEVMCGTRALDVGAIERGEGILVDRAWRAHEAGDLLLVADLRLGTFAPRDDADSLSGIVEPQEISSALLDPSAETCNPTAAMGDKKLTVNLLHLGLVCCNPNPEDRPSMRLASQSLQAAETLMETLMETSLPPLPRCRPQARYSSPLAFSRLMETIPSSSSLTLSAVDVQKAAEQGSFPPTPPSSGVSSAEPLPRMPTSFASASTSSFLTGR